MVVPQAEVEIRTRSREWTAEWASGLHFTHSPNAIYSMRLQATEERNVSGTGTSLLSTTLSQPPWLTDWNQHSREVRDTKT